ncbi:uncharacterized protein (TIGR02588 family) [Nocardiopsis arvandica]|uniref:Uncharacterized protein (TIGR02588 family) n=1 Tax=Nocardiopsis sinuspersici TaxID=501010 RepID=A0A7Y9XDZ1_9ACTN|nr:TIGR02588 family protein [Nocardiopsis sinuspersici]NYH53082.1 uncharacterized protein (TIGR02588 family) [Nocardiopsis sinuspersici]
MSGDERGRDRQQRKRDGEDNEEAHKRSAAEWTMLAVSAAVLLVVVVAVAWLWLAGESRPPAFSTTARPIREVSGTVYVPVEVRNEGTRTAAGVQVVMEGPDGKELADQRIDFLSGGETTTVTFVLPEPRPGLGFAVSSYQRP